MEKKYFDEENIVGESFMEQRKDGYEFLDCIFKKCDFSYSILYDCRFEDCLFENCNLSMTKMDKVIHNNSIFENCKLQGIAFDQCTSSMFKVTFVASSLSYTSFNAKKMPKTVFKKCELKSVDFSQCNLTNSSFEMCELPDCIFNETILDGVDFTTARQYKIDPEKNSLKGARFDQFGLSGLLDKYKIVIV